MSDVTGAKERGVDERAGRTQLFEVSTLYGAATLAAAIDAGLFEPARRVLLVSNNATVPEAAAALEEMTGWDRVVTRFDTVVSWNDTIYPNHPSLWAPEPADVPVWDRLLRGAWGIGDGPLDLVVESVHAKPAAALAEIFADASVEVYADGLMSYGPTRERLQWPTACRIRRLLHLDLIPGLAPMLLSEYEVPARVVPDAAFRAVLDEISGAAAPEAREAAPAGGRTAVLLGQYLAALNILTAAEEESLHERMLRGAAAAGCGTVVFKPHPTAPAQYSRTLEKAAADAGVRLTVLTEPMLAETVFDRFRPDLVVGCFSTALLTASAYYGVPIARVGTELVLSRLRPFQNSNRVPVTLVDAFLPDLEEERAGRVVTADTEAGAALQPLVRVIGFTMQPRMHAALRGEAERWLSEHQGGLAARYVKRSRLTALALPGGFASGVAGQLPGRRAALRFVRKVRGTAAKARR
ncbi:polysialyltransferase family glycosyltransferase [Streptomyces sp. RFCAC02]|uniref:polysialyltransferase family glycosyltransferase n=1 Tax=Streptomyces sp. RFCAC02 TaxID=2499143 RepID=UPI00101FC6D3|nr:polysialyltransferase family glycosyltransferase [Streptomyces sp. RFCAC02]